MNDRKKNDEFFGSKFKNIFSIYALNAKSSIVALLLFAAGIVLCTYAKYTSTEHSNFLNKQSTLSTQQTGIIGNSEFEKELCDILGEINGVGKVKVMISYPNKQSNSNDFSYFSGEYGNYTNKHNYSGGDAIGAVVVADGAGNAQVKSDIVYAVSTLLDIPVCNVKVYENKNNGVNE